MFRRFYVIVLFFFFLYLLSHFPFSPTLSLASFFLFFSKTSPQLHMLIHRQFRQSQNTKTIWSGHFIPYPSVALIDHNMKSTTPSCYIDFWFSLPSKVQPRLSLWPDRSPGFFNHRVFLGFFSLFFLFYIHIDSLTPALSKACNCIYIYIYIYI